MAAETLIRKLTEEGAGEIAGDIVAAVHALVDDSVIDPDAEQLGIAEAARLLGLSPHTLRYYEQEGLVRPARNASGYRGYSAADLRRLVFLTRMRVSGMPMADLRRYVALADQGPATEPERREMMLAHRDRIRQRLRELTLALDATEYKIAAYGGVPSADFAPQHDDATTVRGSG
ncbi:MAG TPA: MerR family transcriptional regulator [Trebonia sp.]|jgi:DNA-binding transcriptional MerR regulator|nr:MerR family transcriptional regulator [Trebonia sp.]